MLSHPAPRALYPQHHRPRSLHAGFLARARHAPNRPALVIRERTYSYGELEFTARRWASRLVDAVPGGPRRVAVFAHRTLTSYAGMLAALLSGAAFVPLNRTYPVERTRFMLQQAQVDAIIVDDGSLPALREILGGLARRPVVLAPESVLRAVDSALPFAFDRAALAGASPLSGTRVVRPDEMAYLLFTSGSSGFPKGVPITHSNVRSFLEANAVRYGFSSSDVFVQTFDATFDLSLFTTFMAWESGASVCEVQPIDLLAPIPLLERNAVTVWFSVPSVAALLIRRNALVPKRMMTLRWSLFCGEALPRVCAEAWQAAAPLSVLENLYGPTELTIACAAYRWDPATSSGECVNDVVPIGSVYPHLPFVIIDGSLRDVRDDESGELCVGGAQRSPGYWLAPQLTERSLLHRLSDEGVPETYYRTGDLVLRRGRHLVYLGRIDSQVQIGGYRVELTEVENVLRRAGCVDVLAVPWPDPAHASSVIALVAGTDDVGRAMEEAGRYLPRHMIPRRILSVAEIPRNANGKADRRAAHAWLAERMGTP